MTITVGSCLVCRRRICNSLLKRSPKLNPCSGYRCPGTKIEVDFALADNPNSRNSPLELDLLHLSQAALWWRPKLHTSIHRNRQSVGLMETFLLDSDKPSFWPLDARSKVFPLICSRIGEEISMIQR